MKKNTKTTPKKISRAVQNKLSDSPTEATVVVSQLGLDFRHSLLLVSIGINVTVLIVWLMLVLTTQYDDAMASLFLHR